MKTTGLNGQADLAGLGSREILHSAVDNSQGKLSLSKINALDAGFIAFGAALNVSIGCLVSALKLPLYLDSLGTILVSVVCGWQYRAIVGLSSLIIMTLTSVPTVIAYAGTAVIVAILASFLTRFGFMSRLFPTITGGLLLGIIAAMASVPVTNFLYGGVSLAGADAVTTFFKASGMPVWKSVLFGSLITDPIDKLVTVLICMSILKTMPHNIILRLGKGGYTRNLKSG